MGDALSRGGPQENSEIKGLDVPIHELIPYLIRVYVDQIQKANQGDKTF